MKEGQAHKESFVGPYRHPNNTNKVKDTDENDQFSTQGLMFFSIKACPAIMF